MVPRLGTVCTKPWYSAVVLGFPKKPLHFSTTGHSVRSEEFRQTSFRGSGSDRRITLKGGMFRCARHDGYGRHGNDTCCHSEGAEATEESQHTTRHSERSEESRQTSFRGSSCGRSIRNKTRRCFATLNMTGKEDIAMIFNMAGWSDTATTPNMAEKKRIGEQGGKGYANRPPHGAVETGLGF